MLLEVWNVTERIFCHFVSFIDFLHSTNNLVNRNFEKMKKTPKDIILAQMCIYHK